MKPKAPKGWMYVTVLIPHSTRGPDFIDGRGMRIIDTVKALAFRDQAESLVRQLRIERALVRAAARACAPSAMAPPYCDFDKGHLGRCSVVKSAMARARRRAQKEAR